MSLRVSTPKAFISACSGLMYSSVPTSVPNCVNSVFSVSRCSVALATPKSITLGTGLSSYMRHQHVGRLDVAVDDAFLMGVLDGLADRHEQLQPLPRRQLVVVAELGDGHALDQLHDEVGPAAVGGAGVEDLAMFGWSIMARACRSASKRAITWPLSMPGLMIFRATLRRTGSSCSAM